MNSLSESGGVHESRSFYEKNIITDISKIGKSFILSDFSRELVLFDTVFFNLDNTKQLRNYLRTSGICMGKTVLDIGTGTGIIALTAIKYGAKSAVGTDINPMAAVNAIYNAELVNMSEKTDIRLVSMDRQGAYSVIKKEEKFDLIISNPPWQNKKPSQIEEFGFFDYRYDLLKSILRGLKDHLNKKGKCLLVYGSIEGYKMLIKLSKKFKLKMSALDEEELNLLLQRKNLNRGIVFVITIP